MTWPNFKTFFLKGTDILACLMMLSAAGWCIFIREYYWGAANFAAFIFMTYLFIKYYADSSRSGRFLGLIILLLFNGHREYKMYKQTVRMEKFGIVFNKTRRQLGIPIIPADWHTKYPFNRSITWVGKEDTIGHKDKDIYLDSLGRISFEIDEYKLKPVKGIEREISMTSDYTKRNRKDFIDYAYDAGNKDTTLSRQQVDSIFKAENIKSDF